jgi:hypothetical protein
MLRYKYPGNLLKCVVCRLLTSDELMVFGQHIKLAAGGTGPVDWTQQNGYWLQVVFEIFGGRVKVFGHGEHAFHGSSLAIFL